MEASDNGGVIQQRMGKVFRILINTTPNNTSRRIKCTFRVIPSEPEKFRSDLEDVIYRNGGDVLSGASSHSDYVVTILNEKYFHDNPDQNCDLPLDTFSSVYIYDAVSAYQKKSPLPDLNIYRLTESKYESYDANRILFQKERWSDQTVKKTQRKTKSKVTAQRVISEWKAAREGPSVATEKNDQLQKQVVEKISQEIERVLEPVPSPESPIRINKTKTKHRRRIVSIESSDSEGPVNNDEVSNEEELGRSPPKKQKIARNTFNDKRIGNEPAKRETEKTAELDANNGDSFDDTVLFDRTPSPDPHASRQRKKNNSPLRTTKYTDNVRVLPQPPPEIETNGTVVPNSNNESAANEEDTGNEDIAPIVKVVPHPSTSAAIKLPALVTRGFAGPSGTKIKSKQTVKANPPSLSGRGKDNDSKDKDDLLSCDDLSCNEDDDDSDTSSNASSNLRSNYHNSRRVPFYTPEGQRILDLICDHNAFMYTKGNKLWELMVQSEKFPGRTQQSLKEHFRKKVLPNALKSRIYRISPVHLKRLQKAQERANWTKHANFCPDYEF